MNRVLLIVLGLASTFWVSGCVVISSERHRSVEEVCVVRVPPRPVVEVIHVPPPPPGPYHHHGYPRRWR